MSSSSINKIYVNGATRMSLNDRFSVIQSVLPTPNIQSTNQAIRHKSPTIGGRRKRSNSLNRGRINNGVPKQASLANRKFLEILEKKHKMQTALKLKRRSMKATMPPAFRRGPSFGQGQRINNRFIGYGGGRPRRGINSGRLLRSNSLVNIATMKADLIPSPVAARIQRSNSTSNLAARLGTLRRNSLQQNSRRLRIRGGNNQQQQQQLRGRSRSRQRNMSRSNSLTNLNRSNSRSNLQRSNIRSNLQRSNLQRSNSRSNLQRSNSRNNINSYNNGAAQRRGRSRSISRNRQNLNVGPTAGIRRSGGQIRGRGNGRFQSANRNLQSNSSIQNRLGVKRLPINANQINKRRLNQQKFGNNFRGGRNIAQGRILKRKNSTGSINNAVINSTGGRQGRTRGRGNSAPQGRSRSQSRGRNRSGQRGGRPGIQRGNRRGGRISGRGINRPSGPKEGVKKEDLDKELDQYMATTKSSDMEM